MELYLSISIMISHDLGTPPEWAAVVDCVSIQIVRRVFIKGGDADVPQG